MCAEGSKRLYAVWTVRRSGVTKQSSISELLLHLPYIRVCLPSLASPLICKVKEQGAILPQLLYKDALGLYSSWDVFEFSFKFREYLKLLLLL